MKTIGVAFVVLSIVAGCKSHPAQQERKVCVEDKSCEAGFNCTAGVCASQPPTAAVYNACSLDVDCPVGDHCDLGACAHDCVADRDCAASQTCDIRGRCAAPAAVNEPAPPAPPTTTAPVLAVAVGQLDFSSFSETKTVTLRNVGEGPLAYRILADRAWVAADPLTGTIVAGESADVTISVAQVGTGTRGTVSVVSTGGAASVRVSIPQTIAGLYQGRFTSRCRRTWGRGRSPSGSRRTPLARSPASSMTRARRPMAFARRWTLRAAWKEIRSGSSS